MKTSIEEKIITIEFSSEQEQELFLDSELFKQLVKWKQTSDDAIKKLNEIVRDFPKISQPFIRTFPDKEEPPFDVSPRIDDPVLFPTYTTESDKHTITRTIVTQSDATPKYSGGCDATPKYGDGCDATPKYGKCEVDFPSKYHCDVDPEFLKKIQKKKKNAEP